MRARKSAAMTIHELNLLKDVELTYSDGMKYLGVKLEKVLIWNPHLIWYIGLTVLTSWEW